jgi:3-hydroxyisobutyrate dehydrogenase-like beta-hydroxyacid dehydrogenase
MTTRIAVLGTGKMGGTIARRLAGAGFDLVLWNRTPERALALGVGRVVDTPAQAARDASIIITSLTGAEAVRATLERPGLGPNDVFFVLQRLVPALALRRTGYVEGHHDPAQFALRDLRKDVDLALEMFGRSDSRVPITTRVQEIVTKAALQTPASDVTGMMLQYAASARGVTVARATRSAERRRAE